MGLRGQRRPRLFKSWEEDPVTTAVEARCTPSSVTRPHRHSIPDRPARSKELYGTRCPSPSIQWVTGNSFLKGETPCMWFWPLTFIECLRFKNNLAITYIYGLGQLSRYSDSLRSRRSGDRIPVGARFSAPVQTSHGAHLTSYTRGTGSLPGVKRLGRGVDHPPPSGAEVKERVELNHYSPTGPSWSVLGWTLPSIFITYILLERYLIKDSNNFTFKRKYQMRRPRQNMLLSYLHQKEGGEEDRKQLKGTFVNRTEDYTGKLRASCFASHFPPEDLIWTSIMRNVCKGLCAGPRNKH